MTLRNLILAALSTLGGVAILSSCASKSSEGLLLTPTIYYKPTVSSYELKCPSSERRDILSPEGHGLAILCQKDYSACLLQGSCFVDDGERVRSYNYHSTKNGVPRFIAVDLKKCPYGYGVQSSCLDPYFSVAADLSIYKPGDVIFIPRLVGALLPTGESHDGFLIVRDSGGAIKGAGRFDFFTGFSDHRRKENSLARLGFGDPKNRFEFRLATEDEKIATLKSRNYPGLKEEVRQAGQL